MTAPSRRAVLHGSVVTSLGLLSACAGTSAGTQGAGPSSIPSGSSTSTSARPARTLLAYFSRAGENYHDGDRIDLKVGNTAVVAGIITDLADVDLYEITAADPYPGTTPSCWAAASGTSRRR